MALSVNTNLMSLTAQRNLSRTQTGLATAMERLSSGLRVNSAKDDAAGLAIASRMEAQVRGLNVAIRNSNDAISLSQTAEGGLAEVGNMLQRMRELAVQSANATNGTSDRTNLQAEYKALSDEVVRQLESTEFNGIAILGANAGDQDFQVGANNGDQITVTTVRLDNHADILAVAVTGATATIATDTTAKAAIDLVDTA
ncbi:MAG: flagellin FliC, partial [Gammaproteobacteria bacterium]